MEFTVQQIADLVHGTVEGNAQQLINGYAKIEEAKPGSLTFLANPKYTHHIYTTQASAVLVSADFKPEAPVQATLIRVADPYATLAQLLNLAAAAIPPKQGVEQPSHVGNDTELPSDIYVGAFAYIGDRVRLGKGVKIYPQVYVGDDVTIGDDVTLYPGVKIYHGCQIGNRCIVQAGAVIGGDGFGFAPCSDGSYQKIAQMGIVVLQDDVEVGANTTIDRATMGATVIERGVKLDNLIQVAHNVVIGEHTAMAAQVGVAGSTKIGKHNVVGGQVGFAGHITVGDRNSIGAQTGVDNSIGSDGKWLGAPVQPALAFAKQTVYLKRIGEMQSQLHALQQTVNQLMAKQS